ncbi:protein-methionine-sulfoxide reductase heme-binding subunit MsrQ [Alteromonas facilis]|uniref:protein-methionine-sulfoxide reductase heme-binding subunit MsrQ n=1 Tax=Alteromonas facilis TaxID=2048004 RepID=UPI000C28DAF2|nr:protein-methionine-sulfoxide reductase heme-binding subunit MsrQ [Alteromonas facilis]
MLSNAWVNSPIKISPKAILLIKVVIHTLCIGLLSNILYLAITDQISGDPVDALLHFTGISAVNTLLLCLTLSPMARRLKMAALIQFRRLLGLYAFFFASLHLMSFAFFELQFEWRLIGEEIIKRPFITVGMAAWIILLALAVTSFKRSQRALKKRWQLIHNCIYVAAPLVIIHFYWSVKSDIYEPLLYAAVLVVLLWLRRVQLKNIFFR